MLPLDLRRFVKLPRMRARHALALVAGVGIIAFHATLPHVTGGGLLALGLAAWLFYRAKHGPRQRDLSRGGLIRALDRLARQSGDDHIAAAILIEVDDFRRLEEDHDRNAIETLLSLIADRIRETLRPQDLVVHLEGALFGVALSTVRRADLETMVQLCTRLQQAVASPFAFGGSHPALTASVGFSLSSRVEGGGAMLLQAATAALSEAQRSGPAAVRSFSDAMRQRIASRSTLAEEIGFAIDRGEIVAHFQPQVSAQTGALTGFEALARWQHPRRGLIPPAEFIPALTQSGHMGRLGQTMLAQSLAALASWDAAGIAVPHVAVNFSGVELRDPRLVDRIMFELDRHEIPTDRLVVEVLETVVAERTDDTVIRNLAQLSRLGCSLDLDDFGTGHASITNIRRFSITRIKIDRSFVSRIDLDPEQQKMVSAILTMAERLGLETLAEGVETEAERAMLAKLGCGHLQGYAIARPMPVADTVTWAKSFTHDRHGTIPFPRQAR